MNEAPIPNGRPSYETGIECCQKSYANQASGVCVSSLPQAPSTPSGPPPGQLPQSIATHARQRSNFITYKCDSYADFPIDSLVVDILFDYEVSVGYTSQPQHLLPDLKKQIMNDLAHNLGCQTSLQRNLRRTTDDGVLLGFRSVEGGDVIDGEKGSCSESEADPSPPNSRCVPVTGHLAAFVKRNTSIDVMIATKDVILNSIQDDMAASKGYSNLTQRIVYVSEHGSKLQHHQNNGDRVDESSNTIYIVVIVVLVFMVGITAGLLLKRKRGQAGQIAPGVDTSSDKCIDYGHSSASSSQENNETDEHQNSIIDHAEFLSGKFASVASVASVGDSSSDGSRDCDDSSSSSDGEQP